MALGRSGVAVRTASVDYTHHLQRISSCFPCLPGPCSNQRRHRLGFLILAILSSMLHARWDMAPFLGGILLCELDLRNTERLDRLKDLTRPAPPSRPMLRRALGSVCFILGLYLSSFPKSNHGGKDCVPGYKWFLSCCPSATATGIGSAHSSSCSPFPGIKRCSGRWRQHSGFTSGNVSFSVYIIHEPFLHLFAFYTVPFFRQWTGEATELQRQAGFYGYAFQRLLAALAR